MNFQEAFSEGWWTGTGIDLGVLDEPGSGEVKALLGRRRFTERLAGGQLFALTSPEARRENLDRYGRNEYRNRCTYATLQQCKAVRAR
jgi:hypothetical protein